MSYWTNIASTIVLETYIEDVNIKERIEEVLKNAPKITGSERNADIFVNVLSGHNTSIEPDCNICDYRHTIINGENGDFSCGADQDYKCPNSKYQTVVAISIVGALRDRFKKQTIKEYKKFIKYLVTKCEFDIDMSTLHITGY